MALKPNNINVVFDGDFLTLHNHIVIEKQGKQLLLITEEKRDLYAVYFSNKVSNIIEIKQTGEALALRRRFTHDEGIGNVNPNEGLVSLDADGKLEITPIVKKSNKNSCDLF